MAWLYWFNKKDQINDKRINSRKVRVVTRFGIVAKERKGDACPGINQTRPEVTYFLKTLLQISK